MLGHRNQAVKKKDEFHFSIFNERSDYLKFFRYILRLPPAYPPSLAAPQPTHHPLFPPPARKRIGEGRRKKREGVHEKG